MRCSTCGTDNPPAAKFCEECGARLICACPRCGHVVGERAKFCLECGAKLTTARAGTTPAQAPLPPESYTPKHLAEKILASRGALEGERKQVTVLFADVAGSTELIRDLDPEDAQQLLDGAVSAMMDAIHRFEGTVSRLMGDGLMAMFGAPIAHEDHALRGCYAALALQAGIQRYAEEMFARRALRLQARVGLNSGEVIVRLVTDDLHMDYTAMGQTVHLAARMEQLAAAGSSALTEPTLRLVEGYVRVRALGRPPIKGLAEPLEVFELLGAGEARTRLQAAAARGLTPFVGRQEELATVHRALERAQAGHGQLIALVGEPGVGKSRLVWEVSHSHRTVGWTILESGSVSYDKATSYLPVIDLLKMYCCIEASDDGRAIREKLTGKLLTLDEGLRPALTPLLALLDVEMDDEAWQALDPPQRRRQTLDAVRHLLLRESREQPLLLVVEDLHWIDAETQALLDSLVESLPTARILLLVNYRPEYQHTWTNRSYYSQLRIDPLSPQRAEELLDVLLGDDASLQPLKALLIERTEGTPFFLEECVRTLIETGALVGERGGYRLAQPIDMLRVPATIQAVLAARIDRLPPEDKQLLQTAAVIGKDVPYALLRAVADDDEDTLQRGLAALRAAEFVYEASLFPELEYTFKHALTHEVAYGSLLQERRRALHARIVEAIEALYAERLAEHVEQLAQHALRGAVWDKAVMYYRQAGEKATGRSAYREAANAIEQALVALEHLPESRERLEQAIDLRLDLRRAIGTFVDIPRMVRLAREAETLAMTLGDRRRLARASSIVAQSGRIVGDYDQALAAARRAVRLADELGEPALRVNARQSLGRIHQARGEYRLAVDSYARGIGLLGEDPHQAGLTTAFSAAADLHGMLAWALSELGAFGEAVGHGEEAVRGAQTLDHPLSLSLARNVLGCVHLARGRLDAAVPLLERGLEAAAAGDFPNLFSWAAAGLGMAHSLAGRDGEGVPLLERAMENAEARRVLDGPSFWLSWLGHAYLLAGRVDEAAERAAQALDVTVARGERGFQAAAVRLLGEIAARRDPPDADEAEIRYSEALALAEELGMRPLQAHGHHGLGKLYRRTNRPEEARIELSTAVEMLRVMEMTFWLPEAEGELADTTGSSSRRHAN